MTDAGAHTSATQPPQSAQQPQLEEFGPASNAPAADAAVPAGPHAATEAGADSRERGGTNGGAAAKRAAQVAYRQYRGEEDLRHVMRLIDAELSEPYSIFTYRYFLHQWPSLCLFACDCARGDPIGTVVAKVEPYKSTGVMRGYIAMLVVEKLYRGVGIGRELVKRAVAAMAAQGAREIVLEAETHNAGALAMYEGLGFVRDKRLERYYLSGTDAFRLKLLLPPPPEDGATAAAKLADEAEAEAEAQRLETAEADAEALRLQALRVEGLG